MARTFPGGAGTDVVTYPSFTATVTASYLIYFNSAGLDTTARRLWDFRAAVLCNTITGIIFSAEFDGGTNGQWGVTPPSDSVWHSILFTFDGSATTNDPIVYIDGVSVTVTEVATPVGNFITTAGAIRMGNNSTGIRCWNGQLAEYGQWNRILSAAEAAIFTKPYSPRIISRGLVAYKPLTGAPADEPDLVNAGSGTVTGTTKSAQPRIIYPAASQSALVAPPVVPAAVIARSRAGSLNSLSDLNSFSLNSIL